MHVTFGFVTAESQVAKYNEHSESFMQSSQMACRGVLKSNAFLNTEQRTVMVVKYCFVTISLVSVAVNFKICPCSDQYA